ncbi:MAG TPA: hypothetical protein VK536_09170 [Candidatus Limnocylindrales bacterium]|nr:hypothetical protein [Candidatus Limnocylindrales bacterium]
MERQEAIEILWAILDKCPGLEQNSICLIPSTVGMLAEGYQIHIAATVCDEAREYLRWLLANYGVEYKEVNERFMIYRRPKTKLPI